jgi:salicylate hydroxylase/6-hydroxynicotinate 3-monooxygenase
MAAVPRIAVVGAGMGGLTAAAALARVGCEVHLFEQAPEFARIGAGIQLGANALAALLPLGPVDRLKEIAVPPAGAQNRSAADDALLGEMPIGDRYEKLYGAPYLQLHRGDLHAVLFETAEKALPPDAVHLGYTLTEVGHDDSGAELRFADGGRFRADAVVGADGIHSRVQDYVCTAPAPEFTGRVAYRAVFPAELLPERFGPWAVKWWGEDRHIVIYEISKGAEIYFVTSLPESDPAVTSWSATGDMDKLRQAFATFPRTVRSVLERCPGAHRWGIYVRQPLPTWTRDHAVLLGDACHPMTPYMAQGAGMAIEDAVVLARCVGAGGDLEMAFTRYEATRRDRAGRVQAESNHNPVMGSRDLGWLYGYDAWTTPLADPDVDERQGR